MITRQNNNAAWDRAIILIDMNCFFAAIEQLDNPKWQGRPVAVTNGTMGTCIITSSYEARKYGVKTGMRIYEAKKLCPRLIQAPSRPERYAEISAKIMDALQQVTPDIEIFSVDEAFLDITKCLHLYNSPIDAAKLAQKVIHAVSGLPCSIGLSGDKTTAKYAAESKKPNGFTVIPPWEAGNTLANVRVTELCGIGEGIGRFLAQHDVIYCKDILKIPVGILTQRFGNIGRRIWFMCQGKDPDSVHTTIATPKSIGHGKVLPPKTSDLEIIKATLMYMAEKVAARLRHNHMYADNFFIGMCNKDWGWLAIKYKVQTATNDGRQIYVGCKQLLAEHPTPGIIRQVQITALNPQTQHRQIDMFETDESRHSDILNLAIDRINQKFGDFTITKAMLLNRTTMSNVISPAWRPIGARQSI